MSTRFLSSSLLFLAITKGSIPFMVIASGPLDTCDTQWPCLQFTYDAIPTNVCSGGDCEYQICMKLDYNGSCGKSDTETVSHTCEKPSAGICFDGVVGFHGSLSNEVLDITSGYSSCQVVPPGGTAEFLIKDGNPTMGCGNKALSLSGGIPITCETYGVQSCTGRGNIDKECVWRVQAPTSCGKNGGGGGDPHFKLWNRTRYSYHGECDLVLLHSDGFEKGLGLDLHIRTTIKDFYSYIETAAIRIGDMVLEISGAGNFWINGQKWSDLDTPLDFSGFTLHTPYTVDKVKVYQLDLNRGDIISFRSYKHFLFVDISGNAQDFGSSVGLMGNYFSGDMLARDQTTVIANPNDFGQEWQVQDYEPKLFHDHREPQSPRAACKMPSSAESKKADRKLRYGKTFGMKLMQAAQDACAGKDKEDLEFCILDVLATEDVDLANMW